MISKTLCDITSLRNFFESNAETQFQIELGEKRQMSFGVASGKMSSGSISPIEAITSHIQYLLKNSGVTVVSWWQCQHIILSYIKEIMTQGKIVNAGNYNDFIVPISQVKTDQGRVAFTLNEITQVLQAINKFSTDSLVSIIHRFFSSGAIPDGSIYGNYKDTSGTSTGKSNVPMMLLGALGLMLVMNKKKKR